MWLVQKAMEGWGNLYGCDPFLEADRSYGDRVHIRSCTIHEMEGDGTFDLVRMHDSFEHVTDPLEVLKSACRLLKADGVLYMTIPVYPNAAFEKYGPHWYQLDAPRHIFLHSKESMKYLAGQSGLFVVDWKYKSNNNQFVRSYFYQHGIPFYEQEPLGSLHFSDGDLAELNREAAICNEREWGDYMEMTLRKSALPGGAGDRKVVFQKFRREESRFAYPYPPVYREPDADYICFTQDEGVSSGHWKVQRVEDLGEEALEPYLAGYDVRFELKQNQVQMGSLSDGGACGELGSLVEIPAMEALPHIGPESGGSEPAADESPEKAQESPVKDAASLLRDVQENPGELRYVFDLAKEYKALGQYDTALGLSVQCLALAVEEGTACSEAGYVTQIFSCLYDLRDDRLFAWAEHLKQAFQLQAAGRAFCAWCLCHLAAAKGKSAAQVLSYFEQYERMLQEYRAGADETETQAFDGMEMAQQDHYIMSAVALGFCFCLKAGYEERALALLERLSLEAVAGKLIAVLEEGFSAEDRVYEALCGKFTVPQWEDWSGVVLDAAGAAFTNAGAQPRMEGRFRELLVRVSVSAVSAWLTHSAVAGNEAVRDRLSSYAFACAEEGKIFEEEISTQELALCSRMLKELYVAKRESEESEKVGQLLRYYVLATGAFLDRYCHKALLADPDSCAVPPENRALYRMATALADGTASSENVALLKQAVAIYPPFHQEIKEILKSLA